MFTGLIEARGRVARAGRRGRAGRLAIEAPFASEVSRGESVAVDGVCLTVASGHREAFEVDVGERTMATTTLGGARAGATVNLERALRLGDRLGGHVVTGHVDGVGLVVAVERTPNGVDVTIEVPAPLEGHLAPRGSIAVDGVSLTVAAVDGPRFTVSLIPETLARTGSGGYRPGTRVNIETDVLAKYQESVARSRVGRQNDAEGAAGGEGLTLERLKELGFTE